MRPMAKKFGQMRLGHSFTRELDAQDTDGAMCVFEFTGGSSRPRHLHYNQDEWYIIDGGFS
jgi:oxalate decarboxylase/phosphoglucose isomerase-like protein (cupin superfamily)